MIELKIKSSNKDGIQTYELFENGRKIISTPSPDALVECIKEELVKEVDYENISM